jgi:hypothetical protein
MPKELAWRQAVDKVLASSPTPLHYREITERIIADGLRTSLGATPAATVNAQIAAPIKHDGEKSPYVKVAKGTYTLRNMASESPVISQKLTKEVEEEVEEEEQYDIISSFGMFWRKDAVEWSPSPNLWGMQQIGATPVDFCKQLGIYLLYDGREVIYVGRATDRPLGRRLYEHTIDRLSVRWDRFSWFGLLPVSDTGELGSLPSQYDAAKLIPALEAVLIEALEPRQNRKRGDDLGAVEYLQRVDPEIQKKRVKGTLDEALKKL